MSVLKPGSSPDQPRVPSSEIPRVAFDVQQLVREVRKAEVDALLSPRMDLSSPEQAPKGDVELAARLAKRAGESDRLRSLVGELPDRHDRTSPIEL